MNGKDALAGSNTRKTESAGAAENCQKLGRFPPEPYLQPTTKYSSISPTVWPSSAHLTISTWLVVTA